MNNFQELSGGWAYNFGGGEEECRGVERGYKRKLLIAVIARHCLSLNARKNVKNLSVIISQ